MSSEQVIKDKAFKKKRFKKRLVVAIVIVTLMIPSFGVWFYRMAYSPNINVDYRDNDGSKVERKAFPFQVKKGMNFEQLADQMSNDGLLGDKTSFYFIAKVMGYQNKVKPGIFMIPPNITNVQCIRILRGSGKVEKRITFNNMRKIDELPALVKDSMRIIDTILLRKLNDPAIAKKYGFTVENFPCMFIPNTYQVYMNYYSDDFLDRMKKEYDKFWTADREALAKQRGLSKIEVSILASIVEEESKHKPELKRIAGVYINRLNKGMLLQADPTVKFALNDFSIKRVLNKHTEVDSPYNTYKYTGLPPGPIRIPSIPYIDAVLNAETHQYIYFCASEKFDGSHNFAKTLSAHNRNAALYHAALNKNNIR